MIVFYEKAPFVFEIINFLKFPPPFKFFFLAVANFGKKLER